ncbi:MAG: OmpA family protein [Limisphaerales bacterium]
MKTTKLIYPLIFALATTLATTGCKHDTGKLTKLPGPPNGQIPDGKDPTTMIPPGPPLNPTETTDIHGQIPTADGWRVEDMNQDREALAAYTVHFAFDSSAIKSSEESNLQAVAAALKSDANAKLLIEGNCDDRGTEEYNRSLGERRALAAREALAKDGIDPARVRTISYGKDRPADPAHDEAAWAKNRRDDFVLLHPKGGV